MYKKESEEIQPDKPQGFEKWLASPGDEGVEIEEIALTPDQINIMREAARLIRDKDSKWQNKAEELSGVLGADIVGVTGHITGAGARVYLEFQRHSDGRFFVFHDENGQEDQPLRILVSEKKLTYQRYWDVGEYVAGVEYSRCECHDWPRLREKSLKKDKPMARAAIKNNHLVANTISLLIFLKVCF